MTIADTVKQTVEDLPPHKQQEVLDFAEFLRHRPAGGRRRSLRGLWKGVRVTEQDIAQMRGEAWGQYMGEHR